jgi:hypothetical protein
MTALSVGLQVSISVGEPATFDKAGYEAKSYTTIIDVESVPEFGGDATISEFIAIATGIVDKGKGSINYGQSTLPIRQKITDAGQAMLKAGFDGAERDSTHSVKLAHPVHGAIYFTCVIGSFTYNFSDANAWYMGSVRFDIKTKPVVVADVYTVTFVAGSNGSIVGQTSQLVVSGSDTDAVYAAPANLYEFTAWSDANTDNPRTITNVTANATLTATFSLI